MARGDSGESAEEEYVAGVGTGASETERLEWGWWRKSGSWFQRQGEAYRHERSIRNEDVVSGRKTVTRDEKFCEEAEQWRGYVDTMVRWLFTSFINYSLLHYQ